MRTFVIGDTQCNKCTGSLTASLSCEATNPASYRINITLVSPEPGTAYVIGTNMGPVTPFSGVIPGAGPYPLTLTYTSMTLPPPANVNVEVQFTMPDGTQCFQSLRIAVPYPCGWEAERTDNDSATANNSPQSMNIATALLVFPNPASDAMTISYDYGTNIYRERNLSVYDEIGRKMESTSPADIHGNWDVNTAQWAPGIYFIRMEGDGQSLQTQRVVVVAH